MHKGFSPFAWALAIFCLPSTLFPLAWFLSPNFSNHPHLTGTQIDFFSIAFWVYPLVLLMIAGLLYKLHRKQAKLAWGLLIIAFITFYYLVTTIIRLAF